jgi:transposase
MLVWLAQLLECGLLRGSFVAPPVIARLRDLTRYRKKLVEDRARGGVVQGSDEIDDDV